MDVTTSAFFREISNNLSILSSIDNKLQALENLNQSIVVEEFADRKGISRKQAFDELKRREEIMRDLAEREVLDEKRVREALHGER